MSVQKLKKILDEWLDDGKRYKALTPYEMNSLVFLYMAVSRGEKYKTFHSAVAELAKEVGLDVQLDKNNVNYEIAIKNEKLSAAKNALKICKYIRSDEYSRMEKLSAIKSLWGYVSKCALTKPIMIHIIDFLLEEVERQKNETY